MSGWLVGRFGSGDIPWSQVEEFAAWVRSLGIETDDLSVCGAVVHGGADNGFYLHLARQLHDASGNCYLNAALNEVALETVIVPVEKDSWPQWLTGMGCGIEDRRLIVELRQQNTALSEHVASLIRKAVRDSGPGPSGVA